MEVGRITGGGVDSGLTIQCELGYDCEAQITSNKGGLTIDDAVQIISIDHICGHASPAEEAPFDEMRIWASGIVEDGGRAQFNFGEPTMVGEWKVCYCQPFGIGGCNTNSQFMQDGGVLQILGLASRDGEFVCYIQSDCQIRIRGAGLSGRDLIMITDIDVECGDPNTAFIASGHFIGEGFLLFDQTRTFAPFTGGSGNVQVGSATSVPYNMGTPTKFYTYRVCYCDEEKTQSKSCSSRKDFQVQAGTLNIRGADISQDRSCFMSDDSCFWRLYGINFHPRDYIMIVPKDSVCGYRPSGNISLEIQSTGFLYSPVGVTNIETTTLSDPYRGMKSEILLPLSKLPGNYHVCYCAHIPEVQECLGNAEPNYQYFQQNVGQLSINGLFADVHQPTNAYGDVLQSTEEYISVRVEAVDTGKLRCAALSRPDTRQVPDTNTIKDCFDYYDGVNGSPVCIGLTDEIALNPGFHLIHIPVDSAKLRHARNWGTFQEQAHVWCLDVSSLCKGLRCALPLTQQGVVIPLMPTVPTFTPADFQETKVAEPITIGRDLGFEQAPEFSRLKIIFKIEDSRRLQDGDYSSVSCNADLAPGVSGITCGQGYLAMCEPAPKMEGTVAVWDNIKLSSSGVYTLCYSSQLRDDSVDGWQAFGQLTVSGPSFPIITVPANPFTPVTAHLPGTGLSSQDAAFIVNAEEGCFFGGSGGRRLKTWALNAPLYTNSSHQGWRIDLPDEGEYNLCWCGPMGDSSLSRCQGVLALNIIVEVLQDCNMTDWWTTEYCTKDCGGGLKTEIRAIDTQPTGGGKACPAERTREVPCNTDPCPLARVDTAETNPLKIEVDVPFQVILKGEHFVPQQDRVLLIPGDANCGDDLNDHFGGAQCTQDGSDSRRLVCGDGINSFRIGDAVTFRVCFCDASALSRAAEVLETTALSCASQQGFTLSPKISGQMFSVEGALDNDNDGESFFTKPVEFLGAEVPVYAFFAAGFLIICSGTCLCLYIFNRRFLNVCWNALKMSCGCGKQDHNKYNQHMDPYALDYGDPYGTATGYDPNNPMLAVADMGMSDPNQQMLALGNAPQQQQQYDEATLAAWDQYYVAMGYPPGTAYTLFSQQQQQQQQQPQLALPDYGQQYDTNAQQHAAQQVALSLMNAPYDAAAAGAGAIPFQPTSVAQQARQPPPQVLTHLHKRTKIHVRILQKYIL